MYHQYDMYDGSGTVELSELYIFTNKEIMNSLWMVYETFLKQVYEREVRLMLNTPVNYGHVLVTFAEISGILVYGVFEWTCLKKNMPKEI